MLKELIKLFVLPMQINMAEAGGGAVELDEDQQAMLDKALAGDETDDEKAARIEAGVLTDEEKAAAEENDDDPNKDESDEEREERERQEAENGGKSKSVPHSRFNEVVMQRNFYSDENRALREENAALKAGEKKKVVEEEEGYDYEEAEDRYLAALKEGDTKVAKAIRREINEQIATDTAAKVTKSLNLDERFAENATAITETQKVQAFTDRIEATFAQYRKGSKEFNAELVSDTIETYKGYVASGMAQSQAIEKATKLCAKAAGIDITKAPVKGLSDQAQQTAAERAEEARKRGAKVNGQQPPKGPASKGGSKHVDAEDIDPETLSDEEFDALPEATKKKLRGDVVA